MKIAVTLAKNKLLLLGLAEPASAADVGIKKQIHVRAMNFMISNEEMKRRIY